MCANVFTHDMKIMPAWLRGGGGWGGGAESFVHVYLHVCILRVT